MARLTEIAKWIEIQLNLHFGIRLSISQTIDSTYRWDKPINLEN